MKINSAGGLEHYQSYVQKLKNNEASAAKAKPGQDAAAGKTDMVTISGDAAARAGYARIVPSISAEAAQGAPAGRLSALRQAVENGTYQVSAGDVADAILGFEAEA